MNNFRLTPISGNYGKTRCAGCSKEFTKRTKNQIYSPDCNCKKIAQEQAQAKHNRKVRLQKAANKL